MGLLARSQVRQSRYAYVLRDVALAEDLARQDQEINRLNREVFTRAVEMGTDAVCDAAPSVKHPSAL